MGSFERETQTAIYFLRGPFSNFYSASFTLDGITFKNSEQAFMYYKAKHFNDDYHAKRILMTSNPAEAKAYGRRVKGFNVEEWTEVSYYYMYKVNTAKYEQNKHLKDLLLSTDNKLLCETNGKDRIWSCGLYANDDRCLDQSKWLGKNLLGLVLMNVRSYLRNKE